MTTKLIRSAFEHETIILPLERIVPQRLVRQCTTRSPRYQRILATLRANLMVEPLVVYPMGSKRKGDYLLLDGHLRRKALESMGVVSVACLVATDDEAFTYNNFVCTMMPIQEHLMIERAIKGGVSEEQISETLGIKLHLIRKKRNLLKGICQEAIDLLRDRPIAQGPLRELRHVKPMRQIEIAELMTASNNYTKRYVRCLVEATAPEQRVEEPTTRTSEISAENLARIEREMEVVGRELTVLENTHGRNVLSLSIAVTYLKSLLANSRVARYLARHHAEVLNEFKQIIDSTALES